MKKIILFFIIIQFSNKLISQTYADSLLNFIINNQKKTSIFCLHNDTIVAQYNESEMMPLTPIYNIFIGLEYSKQAARDIINEEELVHLSEIEKFYLPYLDKENYNAWVNYAKKNNKIKNDSVSYLEIVNGMLQFNLQANAEFLMNTCGFDNVKNNLPIFKMTHSAFYPLPASLFLYQDPKKMGENKILKSIKYLTEPEYCKSIFYINNQLKYDSGVLLKSFKEKQFSEKAKVIWQERLPISNVKDYTLFLQTINKRRMFDEPTYKIWQLSVEKNDKHTFSYEGTYNNIFNRIHYHTQAKEKMEWACFFKNITTIETNSIKKWIPNFELALTTDNNFRAKVKNALKPLQKKQKNK